MNFELGRVVATKGAIALLQERQVNPALLLLRHQLCDWGDLDQEDKCTNDEALKSGGRLFSSYNLHGPDHRVWIITEWDRSVTTILLPEEY